MSMRMRKKRNFEARMEACGDLLLAQGANGILNMKEAAEHYRALIDFKTVFGAERANLPVALEIGCGKGGFVIEVAKREPSVNYIALEKMSNVILTPLEEVKKQGLTNIRFLNIRAECLPCYIPEGSLDLIYLNFSTPLPKLGYATQRLTHRNFLEVYKKLLKKGGILVTCSCSQHVSIKQFNEMLATAAKECGKQIQMVELRMQGKDHASLIGFEESIYLKVVVLYVM